MEAFAPFLTILCTILPISISGVLIARIWRKNAILDPKILKKQNSHREEYTKQLETQKRSLQNKLNSMQRGPQVEGNIDDMGGNNRILIATINRASPKMALNHHSIESRIVKRRRCQTKSICRKKPRPSQTNPWKIP